VTGASLPSLAVVGGPAIETDGVRAERSWTWREFAAQTLERMYAGWSLEARQGPEAEPKEVRREGYVSVYFGVESRTSRMAEADMVEDLGEKAVAYWCRRI